MSPILLLPEDHGPRERLASFRLIVTLVWLLLAGVLAVLLFVPVVFGFENRTLFAGVELDELLHFSFFGALAWVLPLLIRSRLILLLVVFCLLGLAVLSEFFQLGVPNRRFSEMDMLANVLGCFCGLLLGMVLRTLVHKKRSKSAS